MFGPVPSTEIPVLTGGRQLGDALSNRLVRALSAATGLVGVGVLAFGMLAFGTLVFGTVPAEAAPSTMSAVLTFHGVQTADAPSGTDAVTVAPGESIRFSIERPDRISQAAGYWVVLDTHAFPGAPKTVKLSGNKSWTASVGGPGSYPVSWSAYTALGVPIKLHSGEFTSATFTAPAPQTSAPSGTGSPTGTASGSSTSGTGPVVPSGSHAVAGTAVHNRRGGFGAPAPDTGSATTSAARTTQPAGLPADSSSSVTAPAAVAGPTDNTSLADVASVSAHRPARPTGLAVAAILALAVVTAGWVYQYMGLPLPAGAPKWLPHKR
jgi:hypothetical protein